MLSFSVCSQVEFYSCSDNGELIRSSVLDCESQSLGFFPTFQDIAITPNGNLYGLSNELYQIDVANHTLLPIGSAGNATGTGLIALDDGHLVSDRYDSLFLIDVVTGASSTLGKTGFYCQGDLAFYNNELYMASESNHLIRITLDPVTHVITDISDKGFMNTESGAVFSLITASETCFTNVKNLFAIEGANLYRIDTDNADATLVCVLNPGHVSYGAASIDYGSALPPQPVLPNGFTPNGDGINDLYTIDIALEMAEFQVVNRWGQLIYESNEKPVSWDGRTASGEAAEEGVYFYHAVVKGCAKEDRLSGFISLMR